MGLDIGLEIEMKKEKGLEISRKTLLSDIMIRNVITIHIDDRASLVDTLMKSHPIHHLPVLEGDFLRGLISQRDLYHYTLRAI